MAKNVRRTLALQSLENREVMDALPVLLVIADQQHFFYREYNDTRNSLLAAGVDVVVAATTTNPSTPHAGSGQGAGSGIVVPDIALSNANANDYSAIAFVGGWGSSMYQYAFNDPDLNGTTDNFYANSFYNGDSNLNDGIMAPQKIVVNNLINAFLAQDKYVAGVCHGVTVLAWARVNGVSPLTGKNCTVPLKDGTPGMTYNGQFYNNGYVMGQYDQVVANGGFPNSVQGSIGVPGTTTDDVVVDGRIITGSDDWSAAYFGEVIADQVLANANQAPTNINLSANSIAENAPSTATVGTLSTVDPNANDSFTYSLVGGAGSTDNAKFLINGTNLCTAESFNYEQQTSYSLRLRSTDAGGLSFDKVFTIQVTNINEAPTHLALSSNSVFENQSSGTTIGHFLTNDPDTGDTFTYTLVAGAGSTDNAKFAVDGIHLKTAETFDYEGATSFTIRVRTTDAGGLSFEKALTINVNNVNEAPTDLLLSNNSVAEGQPLGTLVGSWSALDADAGDNFTYTLVAGAGDDGNSAFAIVGNQLHTAVVLNRAIQDEYTIRVRVTDVGGLSHDENFIITVTEVNDPPVLDNGPNLVLANLVRNASNPAAIPVHSLLLHASDAETPASLGVALTGKFGANGLWEYASTAQGPWTTIVAVTDSAALLLSGQHYLRFKPAPNVVGYAGIRFRAWDGTVGTPEQWQNPADAPVSFSTASETAWIGVGMPTYNTQSELVWTAMAEDQASSKVQTARNLVGFLATEFPNNTALGVAITATEGYGVWQVRIGSAWQTITGVNATNARLVKPNDQLRFVPAPNWNGVARLTYRAWNPANGLTQPFGDSTQSGFSTAALTSSLTVTPVNDAPILETAFARVFDGTPQNVANLLVGSADIDNTVTGLALTRMNAVNGRWDYRLTPTAAWIPIPPVTNAHALVLDPWAEVRFMANSNASTASGSFDYKAIDESLAFVPGTYRSTTTSTAYSKVVETATYALGNTAPTFNPGNPPKFPDVFGAQAPPSLSANTVLGRMTDSDPGAKRGLAITDSTGNGMWQYSVDNGKTWLNIGDVSSKYILLRNTDRLRFIPANGWTGTASLTFAAWDQTAGVAGDRMAGPSNSLSTATITATLIVK